MKLVDAWTLNGVQVRQLYVGNGLTPRAENS
jgi:hypothetical protein